MFSFWLVIFEFDYLLTVFGCPIVTESMAKIFGFSIISASWEIIFDSIIGFTKLEVVLGCPRAIDFLLPFFGFFTVFDVLEIFFFLFFKNNSYCSIVLLGFWLT